MILSSRQSLLISSTQNKQFFMFDPKTTAVLHKYRTQENIMPHHVYYQQAQQIIAQQVGKTFVSIWNWDSQEVEVKVSLSQAMSSFCLSEDGHYLFGGSNTGTIFMWELPSGLLIKKKALHSTSLNRIIPFKNNFLITSSKSQVKIWPLSSLLIDQDNNTPIKQYTTILDIISIQQQRNIIAVLTHKNLTLLNGSLTNSQKQLQVFKKFDYDYVTVFALSSSSAYVGNGKGDIEVVELMASEQQKLQLNFAANGAELDITRSRKKKVLSGSKHPVTSLAYVSSLAYLVSGHANGQVIVWSNYEIKKSLHLFKTSVSGMLVINKPSQSVKIHQTSKIRPFNKYEQGKDQEPLEVLPRKVQQDKTKELQFQLQEGNEEDEILTRMMSTLRQPQKLLREQLSSLRSQKSQLLSSNLHYFKMLCP